MSVIDLDFRCKGAVSSEFGKKVVKEMTKDEKKAAGIQ